MEVPRACLSLTLARLDQDVDDPFIHNSSPNKPIHSSKMYSEWPKRRGGEGEVEHDTKNVM